MFTDSQDRQSDLAIKRFAALGDHWKRTADQWFDGSVDSVDRRIAHLDSAIAFAADTTSRLGSTNAGYLCASALIDMRNERNGLVSLREALLTGDPGMPPPSQPSQRVAAAVQDFPEELLYLG